MIKSFKKKLQPVDVLVLTVGHKDPEFLADTAESFDHYNAGSDATYRLAFAVDHNPDCANILAKTYGHESVYCSSSVNGWGRGITRTIAYALDHFHRNGIRWEHLITVDSDALIVDRCLDLYVRKIEENVCFVGQKWGGPGPYSSANPGPGERERRQVKLLAKLGLFQEEWSLPDYMVAGPFLLWTRKTLDFLTKVGLLPGSALDEVYRYVLFPHDQMTTLVLGVKGYEYRDVGKVSMLYCGGVGGADDWKSGLPSVEFKPYGQVPLFSDGTAVIHPIRSDKFDEGKVRTFFRKLRNGDLTE